MPLSRIKPFQLLILLAVFVPSIVFSQALEELEKQMAASNNIAQKTRTDFKYVSGKFSESGTRTSTTTFDRAGNTTKVEYYNPKGAVTGSEIYKYDEKGNRILFERTGNSPYKKASNYNEQSQILLESGNNGTEEFRVEYKYNSAGKLSEVINSASGQIQQKMVYSHSGNTAAIEVYIRGTSLSSKMKMKYDDRGNLLEESTYSLDGKELEKKKYTYNSSSQLTEETKLTNGKFYYRISNTYDTENRLRTVSEETLSKESYVKKEYTYDTEGNLKSYKWRRNPDEDFNEKTYSYNAKGICLSEETFYPKSEFKLLTKFSYRFF